MFVHGKSFQSSLVFVVYARAPEKCFNQSALPANIRLGWRVSQGTNTLAYQVQWQITDAKCFIAFGPEVSKYSFLHVANSQLALVKGGRDWSQFKRVSPWGIHSQSSMVNNEWLPTQGLFYKSLSCASIFAH